MEQGKHSNNFYLDVVDSFSRDGFYTVRSALVRGDLLTLKRALNMAMREERLLHRKNFDDDCQVVCCPWYDDVFFNVLKGTVFNVVNALIGKDCILYNYSNSCLLPGQGNFSSHIHVERPYSTGNHIEGVGVIVLLDDFYEENGATWFMAGSHRLEKSPDAKTFFQSARRLVAPAGSLFFFHPHLWHAGGVNNTAHPRTALSIGFCRPYLKQRFDFPAMFSSRARVMQDKELLQKLGFLAKVPDSVESYYKRSGGWWQENC